MNKVVQQQRGIQGPREQIIRDAKTPLINYQLQMPMVKINFVRLKIRSPHKSLQAADY